MDNNIMKFESILPTDFDGTFRFTNWTDEDFVGIWNGREYHFPALSTSPMIMPDQSPVEIQNIRKKFAKNLAEKVFYNSTEYKEKYMRQERNPDGTPRLNSIHQAGTYNVDELTSYIQRCLEPLKITNAVVVETPKVNLEDKLTRNEDGELNTEAIDRKTSLRDKALTK